jgi:hypothetical protein
MAFIQPVTFEKTATFGAWEDLDGKLQLAVV